VFYELGSVVFGQYRASGEVFPAGGLCEPYQQEQLIRNEGLIGSSFCRVDGRDV
jgi:hypothetical protein